MLLVISFSGCINKESTAIDSKQNEDQDKSQYIIDIPITNISEFCKSNNYNGYLEPYNKYITCVNKTIIINQFNISYIINANNLDAKLDLNKLGHTFCSSKKQKFLKLENNNTSLMCEDLAYFLVDFTYYEYLNWSLK